MSGSESLSMTACTKSALSGYGKSIHVRAEDDGRQVALQLDARLEPPRIAPELDVKVG